jgi:hypothetical protein
MTIRMTICLRRWQREHYRAAQFIAKTDHGSLEMDQTAASALTARTFATANGSNASTSLYDWCLSFVRLTNHAAAAE